MTSDTKLADALFPDHGKFIEATFAKREAEIVALHTIKPEDVADTFKQYDDKVRELKKKFGYESAEESKEEKKDEGGAAEQKEQVDFQKEVETVVA